MKLFRELVELIGNGSDFIGPCFAHALRQVATFAHAGYVLLEALQRPHDNGAQHEPGNHGNDKTGKGQKYQCAVYGTLTERRDLFRRSGDELQ